MHKKYLGLNIIVYMITAVCEEIIFGRYLKRGRAVILKWRRDLPKSMKPIIRTKEDDCAVKMSLMAVLRNSPMLCPTITYKHRKLRQTF